MANLLLLLSSRFNSMDASILTPTQLYNEILRLLKLGHSKHAVASILKTSRTTVIRTAARYAKSGSEDLVRDGVGGRPRSTSPTTDRAIFWQVRRGDDVTAAQVGLNFPTISLRTIQRRLKAKGLQYLRKAKKPKLTELQRLQG